MRTGKTATLIMLASLVTGLSTSVTADEPSAAQMQKQIQQAGQAINGGLNRDIIRRNMPAKPDTEHAKPEYGPVLKVKPKGLQPAKDQTVKTRTDKPSPNRADKRAGGSDDKSGKGRQLRKVVAAKPEPLHGIEPDEIDAR